MPVQRKAVVLISSTADEDPLSEALALLTAGCPPEAIERLSLDGTDEPASMVGLVDKVSRAAFVIIQEPARDPRIEHIAAAAAACASAVPLLLVSPVGDAYTQLTRISNAPPSQVIRYPTRRDDAAGWTRLSKDIAEKRDQIRGAYERGQRAHYLDPITARLSSAADTLHQAEPTEAIARTVARIFDRQTSCIRLENHVDFLQLDFPVTLYADLLAQLTSTFSSVRTIADPVAEHLPWRDPVDSHALAMVNERVFAIDEHHTQQYGLEGSITQLQLAIKAGGRISVVGLSEPLRSELIHTSPVRQQLKGLNRFYAGNNIVGGYADEPGEQIRLIAFKDTDQTTSIYSRELNILATIDEKKKTVPLERAEDLTTLASWIYSQVLSKPTVEAILQPRTSPEYANGYDADIVRVTPGYFTQLDMLTIEAKKALVELYSPFSGQGRRNVRMLELGFGTGTLTGRLIRMCADFESQIRNDHQRHERPSIEVDGWDANPRMIEIARQRLIDAARQPHLTELDYDPAVVKYAGDPYDLVLGSFFSHYWADASPDRHVRRAAELHQFQNFLDSIRKHLLTAGGFALFLDAFYTPNRRHAEQAAWRNYLSSEVGSPETADAYLGRNAWQYWAPSVDLVEEVAGNLGFTVWWREAALDHPFKILILRAPTSPTEFDNAAQ